MDYAETLVHSRLAYSRNHLCVHVPLFVLRVPVCGETTIHVQQTSHSSTSVRRGARVLQKAGTKEDLSALLLKLYTVTW